MTASKPVRRFVVPRAPRGTHKPMTDAQKLARKIRRARKAGVIA